MRLEWPVYAFTSGVFLTFALGMLASLSVLLVAAIVSGRRKLADD